MPGGDRTGPAGMGPMTGRAAGFCAGSNAPGYATRGGGRGFGGGDRGAGCGRGRRNRFYATGLPGWQRAGMGYPVFDGPPPPAAPFSAEQQLDALKGQVDYFENTLSELREKIAELEASSKSK